MKKSLMKFRADETGAETAEIILALVLLVIGMMVAWAVLRDTLRTKVEDTATCIEEAGGDTTECE